MATASRLHVAPDHHWIAGRIGNWRAPSLIARCAFFVLGAVAAGLILAVFSFMHSSNGMLPAGLIMLIAAEWLILRKHLFHAGVEEALWAAGLLAVVLQVTQPSIDLGFRSAALVALVLGIAGLRLLNPLFITLAAAAVSCAIVLAGEHTPGMRQTLAAGAFCYATGAMALYAGRLELRRPSHDQMLNWLMVVMPLCGYLWLASEHTAVVRVFTALASAALGIAALVLGLRRRAHAPLLACMVCVGCVAYELRNLTALSVKWKLILWGSAALLLALGLERYLRTPRRGITSAQVGEGGSALDLLQIAGAAALSPRSSPHASGQFKGGGGTFGGGGAGVRY